MIPHLMIVLANHVAVVDYINFLVVVLVVIVIVVFAVVLCFYVKDM